MSGKLRFYDQGHIYELDGQVIPSVSEILRFLSREIYGDIDRYVLDQAAERGTAVHAATEALDRDKTVECPPEIAGYVEGYAKFLREHDVRWKYIEKAAAHPKMLYAGTVDRAGLVDGFRSIVDIKTSAAVKKPLVKAQLNGYRRLMSSKRFYAQRLYCLQLLPDARYRLYPVAIDDTEFMACLSLHRAMQRRHKRGRIE